MPWRNTRVTCSVRNVVLPPQLNGYLNNIVSFSYKTKGPEMFAESFGGKWRGSHRAIIERKEWKTKTT